MGAPAAPGVQTTEADDAINVDDPCGSSDDVGSGDDIGDSRSGEEACRVVEGGAEEEKAEDSHKTRQATQGDRERSEAPDAAKAPTQPVGWAGKSLDVNH